MAMHGPISALLQSSSTRAARRQACFGLTFLAAALGASATAGAAESTLTCDSLVLEQANCLPYGPDHIYVFGGSCTFAIKEQGGPFSGNYASHMALPVAIHVRWDADKKALRERLQMLEGFEWNGNVYGGEVDSEFICSGDPVVNAATCTVAKHENDTGLAHWSELPNASVPLTKGKTTLVAATQVSSMPSCPEAAAAPPPPAPKPVKKPALTSPAPSVPALPDTSGEGSVTVPAASSAPTRVTEQQESSASRSPQPAVNPGPPNATARAAAAGTAVSAADSTATTPQILIEPDEVKLTAGQTSIPIRLTLIWPPAAEPVPEIRSLEFRLPPSIEKLVTAEANPDEWRLSNGTAASSVVFHVDPATPKARYRITVVAGPRPLVQKVMVLDVDRGSTAAAAPAGGTPLRGAEDELSALMTKIGSLVTETELTTTQLVQVLAAQPSTPSSQVRGTDERAAGWQAYEAAMQLWHAEVGALNDKLAALAAQLATARQELADLR